MTYNDMKNLKQEHAPDDLINEYSDIDNVYNDQNNKYVCDMILHNRHCFIHILSVSFPTSL